MARINLIYDASGAKAGAAQAVAAGKQVTAQTKQMVVQQDRWSAAGKRSAAAASSLGTALKSVVAGFTAIAAARNAVRNIADFEVTMTTLRGVSGAVGEEFKALVATARELGATTRFTASQAGEGLLFLARAGFSAREAMQSVRATLNLAATSGLELGEAADFASNILAQFNLQAKEMDRVVDALTNTANNSNTTVRQLAEALKFAGPVAGSLGISVEEAAAALGTLGDRGIQASLAGTNLRGVMLALTAPTARGQKALAEMGLSLEQVREAIEDPIKLFDLMGEGLDTLGTRIEKAAALNDIFGRRNIAAGIILSQNADSIAHLVDEQERLRGSTERLAEEFNRTLKGRALTLVSAYQELTLQVGDEGLSGALKTAIDRVTAWFRVLGDLDTELEVNRELVKGVSAAVGALIGLRLGVWLVRGTAAFLGMNAAMLATPWGAAIAGATALTAAIVGLNAANRERERQQLKALRARIADDARPIDASDVFNVRSVTDPTFLGTGSLLTPQGQEAFAPELLKNGQGINIFERLSTDSQEALALLDQLAITVLNTADQVTRAVPDRMAARFLEGLEATIKLLDQNAEGGDQAAALAATLLRQKQDDITKYGLTPEVQQELATAQSAREQLARETAAEEVAALEKAAAAREAATDALDKFVEGLNNEQRWLREEIDLFEQYKTGQEDIDEVLRMVEETMEIRQAQHEGFQLVLEKEGELNKEAVDQIIALDDQIAALIKTRNEHAAAIEREQAAAEESQRTTEALQREGESAVQQLDRQIQAIEDEIRIVGLSAKEKRLARTEAQALELAEKGLAGGFENAAQKAELLRDRAEELEQLRELEAIAQRVGDAFGRAFDTIIDKALDGTLQLQDFGTALQQLGRDVIKGVVQETITRPLVEEITSSTTGLLKNLFGVESERSTQTMEVAAQVVNVNGGTTLGGSSGGGGVLLGGGSLPTSGGTTPTGTVSATGLSGLFGNNALGSLFGNLGSGASSLLGGLGGGLTGVGGLINSGAGLLGSGLSGIGLTGTGSFLNTILGGQGLGGIVQGAGGLLGGGLGAQPGTLGSLLGGLGGLLGGQQGLGGLVGGLLGGSGAGGTGGFLGGILGSLGGLFGGGGGGDSGGFLSNIFSLIGPLLSIFGSGGGAAFGAVNPTATGRIQPFAYGGAILAGLSIVSNLFGGDKNAMGGVFSGGRHTPFAYGGAILAGLSIVSNLFGGDKNAMGGVFSGGNHTPFAYGGAILAGLSIVSNLFGGDKNAFGGVYNQGSRVRPFAAGGILVDSPHLFPMANGNTGLLGEAGPEAIMPLRKMPSGRLGVESSGGGGGKTVIINNKIYTPDAGSFRKSQFHVRQDQQRAAERDA